MDECHICLDELDASSPIAILNCGHKFHYKCIQEWINKTHRIDKLCVICDKDTEIISIINDKRKQYNLFKCCTIL